MKNATLEKHLKNDRIVASYLVYGSDVKSLRETAVWFASNFNPADVFWLTAKEGSASIQVAETKDFIEKAHLAPVGARKLFIILDASTMTPAAQNKLLKTVEDSPAQTTFMLLATAAQPILNTVKSRCVTVYAQNGSTAPIIPPEIALTAANIFHVKTDDLPIQKRHDIMKATAIMNRNIAANCNAQNHQDLVIMEIIKNAKNS